MTLLDLIHNDGIKTRKIGKTYRARCPWHNGKTNTSLMIDSENGTYHCHGCGKHGDAIQYLRDTRGLSFLEACAELGIDPKEHRARQIKEKGFEPRESVKPNLQWQARAEAFLKESTELLWRNSEALSFLHGRGIQIDTIKAAGLGWNNRTRYEDRESWGLESEKDDKGREKALWLPRGLVIPLLSCADENRGFDSLHAVLRLRIRRPEGEPPYVIVSGSYTGPMVWNLDKKVLLTVESEVDGLLVWQEAGDLVGVIALGTVTAKPDEEMDRLLKQAVLILVSLDFDEAGARASWGFWAKTYGPKAKRWPVPVGKDPSEAFRKGLSIRGWIEAGLTVDTLSERNHKPLEATIRPFPKEWLQRFDKTQLERLAIMTVEGRLSDQEAVRLLN